MTWLCCFSMRGWAPDGVARSSSAPVSGLLSFAQISRRLGAGWPAGPGIWGKLYRQGCLGRRLRLWAGAVPLPAACRLRRYQASIQTTCLSLCHLRLPVPRCQGLQEWRSRRSRPAGRPCPFSREQIMLLLSCSSSHHIQRPGRLRLLLLRLLLSQPPSHFDVTLMPPGTQLTAR